MSSKSNKQVYIIGGFAAIGGFLFGYDTGVISGVLTMTNFISEFGDAISKAQGTLSSSISGAIVGVLLFGCFIGALVAGQAGDLLSRKYSIILFSIIFNIGAILQAASIHIAMLLISRFIAGVSVGALSMLVPVYQSEIATKEIRGRLVSLQQWAITIGIAVSFWINYGTNRHLSHSSASWRIPLALQIVPALILGIGILFFPFSPRWLISQNRESDALAALMRIRSASASDVQSELDEIKNEIVLEDQQGVRSYMKLVHAPLRRRLILGTGIQIFQQLTGINSIMYYAPEIFKQAGLVGQEASLLATGINGCVNIIATIPAILFIDKLGRRLILIVGAIIMALAMLTIGGVMGTYGHKEVNATTGAVSVIIPNHTASYVIIVFVYVFVAGFAFSWGPTAWIYCTEIFPLTMRAKGTSVTTAANWAANCAVSFIVPVMLERITFGTYLFFGVLCVIMGILTFLFYPETKGRSLEDMDQVFDQSVLVLSSSKNINALKNATVRGSIVSSKHSGDSTTTNKNNLNASFDGFIELRQPRQLVSHTAIKGQSDNTEQNGLCVYF